MSRRDSKTQTSTTLFGSVSRSLMSVAQQKGGKKAGDALDKVEESLLQEGSTEKRACMAPSPPPSIPKSKDRSKKSKKIESFGPCERFFLLVFCGHKIDTDDYENKQPLNRNTRRLFFFFNSSNRKRKFAQKRNTLLVKFRKKWFAPFFSDVGGFKWAKIYAGFEPKMTKKNSKKAKTIFRLMEKMNATREIAAKTFSALFRNYPSTVAYMVTAIRERETEQTLSAMISSNKDLSSPGSPKKSIKSSSVHSPQQLSAMLKQSLQLPKSGKSGVFGTTVDPAFYSCMFNQKEISYFTPMDIRHSFLDDQELVHFAPLISHLGAVTASLVYVVNVMHDLPEVFSFLDELSRIHSKIPGIDASYFRHTFECIDEALVTLIGSDIYKGEWRKAMIEVLEWIYYYSTREMPDDYRQTV